MKTFKSLTLGMAFLCLSINIHAQTNIDFRTLFDQLGEDQQQAFFDQLSELDITELNGHLQSCGAIDRLRDMLNGDLHFDEFGDLIRTFDNAGVYIDDWLGNLFGLSDEDAAILFGQFDNIEDAFGNNLDSLQNAFSQYRDSINGNDPGIQIGGNQNLDIVQGQLEDQLVRLIQMIHLHY